MAKRSQYFALAQADGIRNGSGQLTSQLGILQNAGMPFGLPKQTPTVAAEKETVGVLLFEAEFSANKKRNGVNKYKRSSKRKSQQLTF